MKKWILLGLMVLGVLQFSLWMGSAGIKDFLGLNQQIKVQIHDNQELLERNAQLTGDVIDLKEGLEAIEERARNEMGMIKEGETFYQVVSD